MPNPTDSTPEQDEQDAAPPPRRRGMPGTAKNMIISMLAVLVGCLAWVWLIPQNSHPTKEVKNVSSIAREVSKKQDWDVALPHGLEEGWTPINVRLFQADNQPPTWHAGYQTPEDEFVSAEQTKTGSQVWLDKQTQDGEPAGKATIDGAQWTRYESGETRSLVRSKPLGGLATVVTGKVKWGDLQTFAEALRPRSSTGA